MVQLITIFFSRADIVISTEAGGREWRGPGEINFFRTYEGQRLKEDVYHQVKIKRILRIVKRIVWIIERIVRIIKEACGLLKELCGL